jgi:hypothetical protein
VGFLEGRFEFRPPGFIEEAAREERWTETEWNGLEATILAQLMAKHGVASLSLVGTDLFASGAIEEHVRINASASRPIYDGVLGLARRLNRPPRQNRSLG